VTEATATQPEASAAPRPWRDLALRGASAAVLIPIAVFGIWCGGVVWDVLIGAVMVLLSWEWLRLSGASVYRWPGILLPIITLGVMLLAAFGPPIGALGLLVAGCAVLLVLQRHGDIWPAAGLFYIGLCGFP
jgi:phosphatidate cytidylyltransferase